ncbi:uncharacterized protein [Palaemon carinicauda]|uniref:uncharacterized protein n=1 Tax=Palaemon carinicauda TaxID=392227 RepID=UPI0035B63E2B
MLKKSVENAPLGEERLRYRLFRILWGPVKQAFLYVFHQTYPQTTDVYEFASHHPDLFTKGELLSLQHERKINCFSLPLLFSVIKSSCNPPLAHPTASVWKEITDSNSVDLGTTDVALEKLLVILLMKYEEAADMNNPMNEEDFVEKVTVIQHCLKYLIEGVGKFDVSGRCGEFGEKTMNSVTDIEQREVFPVDEITDDIKIELRMSYHYEESRDIDPFLLRLIRVPPVTQEVKKKRHTRPPDVKVAVADILKTFPSNDCKGTQRICLIIGEPGCGRSTLSSALARSWSKRDEQVKGIDKYDAVVTVSGLSLSCRQNNFMPNVLPVCTSVYGENEVRERLLGLRVLLIVDDAEELSEICNEELEAFVHKSDRMDVLMLTSRAHFIHLEKTWMSHICDKLEVCGLNREQIVHSGEHIIGHKKPSCYKTFRHFLRSNISRLELVLKHPVSLLEVCEAWMDSEEIFKDVTTCTDLLWTITKWKFDKVLQSALEIVDNAKLKDWLLIAGLTALESIKDDNRFEKSYMKQLDFETSKMFRSVSSWSVMSVIFKKRYIHRGRHCSDLSIAHKLQQEFLAAWYVVHKVIEGKPLRALLEGVRCPYYMALFMVGFLLRIPDYKWISMLHERRVINAVVNHAEGSNEDLYLNLDLVSEVKGLSRLVEFIVDFSEYPDEWNLHAGDVQLIPIQTLLFHVAPTRIFLNVEKVKPYSELEELLSFLCRVDIFIWLDSSCQFDYGNKNKMDKIAKSFSSPSTKTRVDLIKGCLSSNVLEEIVSQTAFSYLVFLKLRVVDLKNLLSVLKAPKSLPSLLWLEIKFDFNVLDQDVCTLPKTVAPLLDVHLQGLDDSSVSKVANLLGSIHDCYSGIHLDNTTLTPEGVFVLLKQLQKRKVYLHCPAEYREKFRRWYYPQLTNFDKSVELTDELARRLLGFDDRMYYSNHCVNSSCFALALDSWNLSSYLEEETSIMHFTYKTDNMTCIKGLKGSVDVVVNGECQVRKTQTAQGS